jgi:DNA repair protein RecO (recombination protein O)
MEYKYTGIILNKRDIAETDRIYVIYTLENGKVKAIAKGVRKPHAKLASSLETLTLSDITIVKNRGMGKIAGSIAENVYLDLKGNSETLLETFRAVALFEKLVDFENKDEEIFELLCSYLEGMNEVAKKQDDLEKSRLLYLGFCVKLLDYLGYRIEASKCVIGGCRLEGDRHYFSPKHGGVVCCDCATDEMKMLAITKNSIKIMRIFFQNKMHSLQKLKVEKMN